MDYIESTFQKNLDGSTVRLMSYLLNKEWEEICACMFELVTAADSHPPPVGKVTQRKASRRALLGLFPGSLSSLPDSMGRGKHRGYRITIDARINPAHFQSGAQWTEMYARGHRKDVGNAHFSTDTRAIHIASARPHVSSCSTL